MMDQIEMTRVIGEALGGTPEWIRQELASKDSSLRARAEEGLAAILAAAITREEAGTREGAGETKD